MLSNACFTTSETLSWTPPARFNLNLPFSWEHRVLGASLGDAACVRWREKSKQELALWSRQRSRNKGSGAGMSLAGSQNQQPQRKARVAPGSELGSVQDGLRLEKAARSTHVGSGGSLSTDWVAETTDIFSPTVLEAEKSKIKVPADWVLREGPLPGSYGGQRPSCYVLTWSFPSACT